ncbi:hypothetical protein CJF32_00011274 [Rutstroemia sp. NJR-2017a WRK4]|nr:hypothetical protein CJF32_00011274 [Rutstroemia sp. NJR-2017a WRK4]
MTTTTTTSEIELQPLPNNSSTSSWSPQTPPTRQELEDIRQDTSPPTTAVDALQRWNHPRINVFRVGASFWGFLTIGMNDGSYGLETYYNLTYTIISLIFLSPFLGYTLASIVNDSMHVRFGQRGIAILAPLCHFISYIALATHPPYAVLVVMFIVIGFGNGLVDAAWCAWIGNMADANQVSGFLQACYSLGGTIAPLIAAGLLAKAGLPWWVFYYVMIAMSGIELITSTWAFWAQTGAVYAAENPRDANAKTGRMREALSNKLTWIFAAFVFGYVGAEGGWIVVFMTRVRSASTFDSTLTSTGFWAGMTVGRIALSFLTARLGEFTSVLVYLAICLGLELIFWLVPSFYVSAVAIALLGMFLGPLFPTAIVLVTKLMPKELHVGSIGFATALGGSGGAIFPFVVGAIAQSKGVQTLQPVVVAILVVIAGLWCLVPNKGKREESERETGSERERQVVADRL